MDLFIRLFYSAFFIYLGYLIIRYRKQLHGWTGNFVWAEHYIGRGGTYLILVGIGLLCIFYGAMYPFGGIELVFKEQ
ncbi:MAG: hypothetical protein PHI37_02115 [Candidatus Gracilibacteria bacterium]|nr:hypothetical protein [Candidatus Gracilibacteria bacterium]